MAGASDVPNGLSRARARRLGGHTGGSARGTVIASVMKYNEILSMSHGLKKHTHEERERIALALVPLIKRHLGGNLLALAATGSFARNADGEYSDIDLIGFVRKADEDHSGSRYVYDGMVIDLWFTTKMEYLGRFKYNVRPIWPYVADGALVPILNAPFVHAIQATPSKASPEACRQTLRSLWPEVQESTAKVLTAVASGNIDPLPLLFHEMAERMCVALSLLNAEPFTTRSAILTEARRFPRRPPHFELLVIAPNFAIDAFEFERRARLVFGEIEELLCSEELNPYESDLGFFVSPRSRLRRLYEWLKIDRLGPRLAKLARRIAGSANTEILA